MQPRNCSVGLTEKKLKKGYELKMVNSFSASGKAKASGTPDGFVKVILMQNMVNGWVVT
jgi:dihydrolipoamide dehydrogenase